ncbi:hypothetical protein MmiEs2_00870 [Methanimicrococcus stummii]|uniref:Uncharacterized protein n=1 Tax=Methanimicrococcus stummii TaxID=3028294 RepID=A0AA97A755_9EURY|nr:hypothetical protein [Methanimicrococcus sp. Es2]WNY27908.1 hypothetical protein MmiEs2_00870 [Methanimicrococcus sp. Es2]
MNNKGNDEKSGEMKYNFAENSSSNKEIMEIISQSLLVPIRICKNVIKGLLLFAGALLVAIGYFTAFAFLIVGLTAIVIGIMNYTAGAGSAFLFAFGGGLLAVGLAAPIFYATNYVLREYIGLSVKTIRELKKSVYRIEVE